MLSSKRLKIAVVGTGVSGLSAAWLLHRAHDIVVYEKANRIGGHANTVVVETAKGKVAVDTGFIVFNPQTYPNFVALLEAIGVASDPSNMSFAASLCGGAHEYSGGDLRALFGQKENMFRSRFWSMLIDLARFYRQAPGALKSGACDRMTLGEYLKHGRFGKAFEEDHILPMAGAIWSVAPSQILEFPARAFIQFYENHGLFKFVGRPVWRSVRGGSTAYVQALTRGFAPQIRVNAKAQRIRRWEGGASVRTDEGSEEVFDHVVIASHADEALAMLEAPSENERRLLSAFRYSNNVALLHRDESFMPRRRHNWASWNTFDDGDADARICATYWMNSLQKLDTQENLFVSLNPTREPAPGSVIKRELYEHPIFDASALEAQKALWALQGRQNTWFCGAHFGAGFHEDGVQSGLAVAEALGGLRRPWQVADESGRLPAPLIPAAVPKAALGFT
jgi:uncharacterized protein